jgi:DNA-binding protein HU-beta
MNRKQLIAEVSDQTDYQKSAVKEIVTQLTTAIRQHLKKGEAVTLFGFGKFYVRNRPARLGVNPKTGEKIKIPATRVAKFKASKTWRKALSRRPAPAATSL